MDLTPLHIFNQEENTMDSEEIGVEEERSEETSEEEGEVSNTLPQAIVVWKNQAPNSKRSGTSCSLRMVNQDSTLRLPVFDGMGKDGAEQHWFTCEANWYVKRITDKVAKIMQLETMFRDKALMWLQKLRRSNERKRNRLGL
jgi:hypothetical protein